MRTDDDIEVYLSKSELPFETMGPGMWVVHDDNNQLENIVLYHNSPVLTLRVKVMPLPSSNREALFEALLRLNTTELIHGAYGIEGDSIVLVDSLQSENLDINEIQASIDSLSMALVSHYETLSAFRDDSKEKPTT